MYWFTIKIIRLIYLKIIVIWKCTNHHLGVIFRLPHLLRVVKLKINKIIISIKAFKICHYQNYQKKKILSICICTIYLFASTYLSLVKLDLILNLNSMHIFLGQSMFYHGDPNIKNCGLVKVVEKDGKEETRTNQ